MDLVAIDFPAQLANVPGLSHKLLASHHQNNYIGALKRCNAIRAELRQLPFAPMSFAQLPGYCLNGLKREELIAINSVVLHELYFGSIGNTPQAIPVPMELALSASFGSVEAWRAEFAAMGKALGGGSGWVLLSLSARDGRLINQWAADHAHTQAGTVPLLALDMYEHAYHLDYGAQAGAYVDAFMTAIDWSAVYRRYQHAVHALSESLGAEQSDIGTALLLDVRRAAVFDAADTLISGARWCDPSKIADWAPALPAEGDVIVYCIYGHEVGRATALRLRAEFGRNARFLRGGIDGWTRANQPVARKGGSS